ncbi:50S ribosomal protein L35 [Candidatus Desantisbacteria bacterium]|nr:50S ribosomal protein L35 [Candidatus Desantisbacteria bacterium]
MPKLKTKKGAAKRFRKTKSGHLKRQKAFGSHLLTKKSSKRKRSSKQSCLTNKTDEKNIKQLLPSI